MKRTLTLLVAVIAIAGCKKDDTKPKVTGCMNPNATNYNVQATDSLGAICYYQGTGVVCAAVHALMFFLIVTDPTFSNKVF